MKTSQRSVGFVVIMAAAVMTVSGPVAAHAAGTAKGGGAALIGANRRVEVRAAARHSDQHNEGMSCPKCKTETVRHAELSSKGSQPRVVVSQRHACAACKDSLEVRGHGKMKQTVVSHACSESGDETNNCCAKH